jgi:Holliday junction resolvase RusA-like endonuclease
MIVLSIKNIKFASINEKYCKNKQGRLYLSKPYREFKEIIQMCCRKDNLRNNGCIKSPYRVIIHFSAYHDIDAFLKPVIDGIQAAGIIDNDKNIHELYVFKKPLKRGEVGNLKVEIETI